MTQDDAKLIKRAYAVRKWDSAMGRERSETRIPYLEEELADRIEALSAEVKRLDKELSGQRDNTVRWFEENRQAEAECLKLRTELEAAHEALTSTATLRQFGLCWCDTIAGIYCVGQEKCKKARAALKAREGK